MSNRRDHNGPLAPLKKLGDVPKCHIAGLPEPQRIETGPIFGAIARIDRRVKYAAAHAEAAKIKMMDDWK